MTRIRTFGIVLLFCRVAAGQASQCARAADQLRSESLLEKAWGAHWASACHATELAADIAEGFARLGPGKPGDHESGRFWARQAMLDALIQLRQPLAPRLLEPVANDAPTEATILMLRDVNENRRLLFAVRAHGGPEWVAASNALARLRAPGFAADLLVEVPLSHSFVISDLREYCCQGTADPLAPLAPKFRLPPGFPPTAVYRLTAKPGPDDELVSGGPTPMYLERTVIQPGTEVVRPVEGFRHPDMEIEYLAELARQPRAVVESAVAPKTFLAWTDIPRFRADISDAFAAQHAALKRLSDALISAGAMEPAESAVTLHIGVQIYDRRTDHSVPLPPGQTVHLQL